MIHLYYTYSVSKLPYRRAFISATSNREFLPDFLKGNMKPRAESLTAESEKLPSSRQALNPKGRA